VIAIPLAVGAQFEQLGLTRRVSRFQLDQAALELCEALGVRTQL